MSSHIERAPAADQSSFATLYSQTMEDAVSVLRGLGHEPSSEQLDAMEHRIRKGVESGLGECWHVVMQMACEIAWEELQADEQ